MEMQPNSIEYLGDELGFVLDYGTSKVKVVMTIEGLCLANDDGETHLTQSWENFFLGELDSHICGVCEKDFYHDNPNYIDEEPVCPACWTERYPDDEYGCGDDVFTHNFDDEDDDDDDDGYLDEDDSEEEDK